MIPVKRITLSQMGRFCPMFSPEQFVLECGLTERWLSARWSCPPVIPEKVEFLETQDTLLYGTLYLVQSPAAASAFFAGSDIHIIDGAFLIVAEADHQAPAWIKSVPQLTVLGLQESAGRIFNAFSSYRLSLLRRRRVVSFAKAWDMLMSAAGMSETDLAELLDPYLDVQARYFQLAVIHSFDESQPILDDSFVRQLRVLIPHSQDVSARHEIVIVMSHNDYLRGCPCDEHALTQLLASRNAYCSLSFTSGYLRDLRPLYYLCNRSLEISKAMGSNTQRVLYANNYAIFNLIDLAAKSYYHEFSDYNGFMLLAHPAVVHLRNYDFDNGDNLTEVLYAFLLCDCNAAKAASQLYMHRNTVVNKVRKISELIADDLSDNNTRQMLLYSCQIASYTQKILQLNPK